MQRVPAIELSDVSKTFRLSNGQEIVALDDVSLNIEEGAFVALLGPSGCGKSTILRLIAALDTPCTGHIRVEGVAPAELSRAHRLGVAFQDAALLPWLSIEANISLPFRLAGRPVDQARVKELIRLVGLAEFAHARPSQLSGGMRQRAAIARALVLTPEVLLLDEPFGALDAVTRRNMNLELMRLWTAQQTTTLLITHDVSEALFLADRIIVLKPRPGRIAHVVDVPFTRPRDAAIMRTEQFHSMADTLTNMLAEGFDEQARDQDPSRASS